MNTVKPAWTHRPGEDAVREGQPEEVTALLHRLAQHDIIALVPHHQPPHSDPIGAEFLTAEELARLLGVDPSSVRRWRTASPTQGPPYVRLSDRVVKYRREDVERWLASRRVDPEAA